MNEVDCARTGDIVDSDLDFVSLRLEPVFFVGGQVLDGVHEEVVLEDASLFGNEVAAHALQDVLVDLCVLDRLEQTLIEVNVL